MISLRVGEAVGIALIIVAMCVVLTMSLILAGCNDVPQANTAPPVEQQQHTIRYLAKVEPFHGPTVYIVEVDGQQYVAVEGYGVAKKDPPPPAQPIINAR